MFMRMIYDERLAQTAYLIGCQKTGEAVVIDPERDVDRYLELAAANNLRIVAVAETHIHADFLSGARELAEEVGAKVYVSDEGDADWKYQWLNAKSGGGSYEHRLLRHGETFSIGGIDFKVLHTPGHTPEHIAFLVTDRGGGATEPVAMITGDFLFVGDLGRPDLLETAAGQAGAMEPAARRLFETLAALDEVPEFVQVWPGHGAGSACGKALGAIPISTVGYEKRFNPAIRAATDENAFTHYILAGQPEPPLYFASMKRDNKIGPRLLGGLPTPPRMTADDMRSLDARRVALIDTRKWEEFRRGHIPNALYIPLGNAFCTDAGSLVDEKEDIYLVLAESELDEAMRLLIRIGLDNIRGWFDAAEVGDYAGVRSPLATIEERSTAEAAGLIEDGTVRVLDVRRATEFAEGHLLGAVNIAHTRLASRLAEVPEGELLINCRSGGRSARAAAYLKRRGHQVINLKGGYSGWENAHPHTQHA